MKKKYIIALEDRNVWSCGVPAKTLLLSDVSIFGTDLSSVNTGIELTPYTEPDLEQVRKEGYEEGRNSLLIEVQKAGKNTIKLEEDEYYQRGLADAWEAARKIAFNKARGGLTYRELETIFGTDEMTEILDMSASEAIEKIRQYEQEKEEINVGDEVIRHYKSEFAEGDDAPSIFLSEEDGYFRCLAFNGRSIMIAEYPKKQYRKTGRHFPEIAEVLQKMKEA